MLTIADKPNPNLFSTIYYFQIPLSSFPLRILKQYMAIKPPPPLRK
jgi:hypothetical protein